MAHQQFRPCLGAVTPAGAQDTPLYLGVPGYPARGLPGRI
jgi:hypothetical protein